MKKKYVAPSVSRMEFRTEDILAASSVDPVGTFTIGGSSDDSGSSSGSTDNEPWPDGWDTPFDNLDVW